MAEPELTWGQWLESNSEAGDLVYISTELGHQPWNPTEKDREAAWILYTEIRTRISTQPLHYRSGDEETALDSLYKLFALTRKTVEDRGPGCRHFATVAIQVLNGHIRPLTAKWHKKKVEGRLLHDDDRRQFRRELQIVQRRLVDFCRLLGSMAEGEAFSHGDSCKSETHKADTIGVCATGADILFDRILPEDDSASEGSALFQAERKSIRERRNDQGPVHNLIGLACSGGGIRAATFCLGVAQSLARRGLLPRVDYLSTVSGGGYFGAFLSSFLNDANTQRVGLEPDKLPFAQARQAEPTPIRQLRNNSKYLLKGGLLGQSRMAGLLLFGILVNLLTLLPVIFGALTLTKAAALFDVTQEAVRIALIVLSGLLFVVLLGLPIIYRLWASDRDRVARYEELGIRVALLLAGVWVLGWVFPSAYRSLVCLTGSASAVLGLFAALPVLFAGAAFLLGAATVVGRLLIVLAGIAGPLLLLMVYFVLNDWIPTPTDWGWIIGLALISAALIAWLWFVDANQISPHRYYRKRLAETYLLRRGETTAIDPQKLSGLRSANARAPYHLINAAVNLPASKESGLRGRNSDFFLFSQDFCGSPVLGYCPTQHLEDKDPNLDLGTAMAVSGAAASAHMGTKTIKGLEFWLALLNIRFGYWLPNPKRLADTPDGRGPHPFSLWRELFGGIDEHGKFVNLSDGGHIENLGIYELLRRRCKFIVAIDGEADRGMTFPSLMKLIRYARIDLGIDIRMDLDDLRRNEAGFSKAHFALGFIHYGDDCTGYLLYIKSSLTGNERDYILDYRQGHPTFPHETTADQFFSEAQFEAYRALGEHIGDDLFHPELIGEDAQPTVDSWFGALARNLLEEPI